MKRTRTAGFSLVEMVVVAAILSFVLGMPLMIFRSAERMQSTVTTRVELQAMVRQTLDRIASRLEGSSAAMIPQSLLGAGVGSPIVDFQVASGWNGANITWGPPERIALLPSPEDPDDGRDNDSDGLIDERIVVWTTNVGLASQRSAVLRRDVPERLAGEIAGNGIDENGNGLMNEAGLSFEFVDDQVVIRHSLQGRDSSNATIVHSEERRIAFRN
jgi:prepilin-type N-terminal cleavage/methylation domain-containing protein